MEIGTFVIDFFTAREWASITLIALFVLLSARARSVRDSMVGVSKSIFPLEDFSTHYLRPDIFIHICIRPL